MVISERSFSTTHGIHWPMLLSWIPSAVIFGLAGIALAMSLTTTKLVYWSLLFGGLYSIVDFAMSRHAFGADVDFLTYFWVYGRYFVPPIACALAACVTRSHAEHRLRNP